MLLCVLCTDQRLVVVGALDTLSRHAKHYSRSSFIRVNKTKKKKEKRVNSVVTILVVLDGGLRGAVEVSETNSH
jgi:hypothetical protein